MHDAVVTVFGGSGFIGRHLIGRLAAKGATIRVPTRLPESAMFLKPMGAVGQIVLERFDPRGRAERGCTGRRCDACRQSDRHPVRAKGWRLPRTHTRLAERIAAASAAAGARRLVQISALGADPAAPSLYARTKAEGKPR